MASDLSLSRTIAGSGVPRRGPATSILQRAALLPLALVLLASLAGVFLRDPTHERWAAVLAGLMALTLLAAVTGHHASTRLGIAFTATVAALALPSQVSWWPLPGAVGVGAYLVCYVLDRRRPAQHNAIFRLGGLTVVEFRTIVGLALLTAMILLAFRHTFGPPRWGSVTELLTLLSPLALVGIGLGFALVNALVEEVLFRGAMLQHLADALGAWPAVVVQALAFGLIHFHGYPYGPVGVVLAAIYGLVLGALRLHSGGLLAPWIAHVCADIVIFVLLIGSRTW